MPREIKAYGGGRNSNEWSNWLIQVTNFYKSSRDDGARKADALFVRKANDNRPYVRVKMFDREVEALLDSGATDSALGGTGMWLIDCFNLHVYESTVQHIGTADGTPQKIVGYVNIPVTLENVCRMIKFWLVPSLSHSVILGNDFIRHFELLVNFKTGTVTLAKYEKEVNTSYYNQIAAINRIHSRNDLEAQQQQQLQEVIGKFELLSWKSGTKLGRTTKVKHKIDTGDATPFLLNNVIITCRRTC